MSEPTASSTTDLAEKIARLAEEKGWNAEDLARNSGLNRQTIVSIFQPAGDRRLRNKTIASCARALGLSVNELRCQSLETLLARMHTTPESNGESTEKLHRLYEQATQPELLAWMERNPERSQQLTAEETDELLSLQGVGGPLTTFGVEHFVAMFERRRALWQKILVVSNTEYMDLLEQLIELMYDKIQPYRDRR